MLLDSQLEQQPDDTHRGIWRWLDERALRYPVGLDVPPLRPPNGPGRAHKWGALELVCEDEPGEGCPRPVTIDVAAGSEPFAVALPRDEKAGALLAATLFSRKARGTAYVLGRGGRWDLHILFKRFYRSWLSLGYEVSPIVAGTDVKLVTVRRDKHAWHLVDWKGLTGLDPDGLAEQARAFGEPRAPHEPRAVGLARAVEGYAAFVLSHFGVHARLTLGQTAIAAASRTLPDDSWLWRPNRLATALCREGGAFRGGYCYYPAYRGPGHKIDMRRAYAWAISQELPCGTYRGPCDADGHERPGIYVCEVRGPGVLPAYLAVWEPSTGGFRRRLWSGDHCHACLPSSEFAGLRALGYRVAPGWGAVYLRPVSFRGLVGRAEGILERDGPDSVTGTAAKLLTNAVYGKLAERPERDGLVFSTEPPSPWHLPFTDTTGDAVDGAWCNPKTEWRRHQHVDVAAEITALVRSRLYGAIGRLTECGIGILAADTDGIVLTHAPDGALTMDPGAVGGWRYQGYDPDLTIAAPRFATWRGHAISAGTSRQSPQTVQLAHAKGVVSVEGRVMAPPWQNGAITRKVRRVLRRGA